MTPELTPAPTELSFLPEELADEWGGGFEYVTPQQAALRLGISRRRLDEMLSGGEIPYLWDHNRHKRIFVDTLDGILSQRYANYSHDAALLAPTITVGRQDPAQTVCIACGQSDRRFLHGVVEVEGRKGRLCYPCLQPYRLYCQVRRTLVTRHTT